MKIPEKVSRLLSSGRAEDLALGITALIGMKIPNCDIVDILRKVEVEPSIPYPLVLMDGYQIGATVSCWCVSEYPRNERQNWEWSYSKGHKYDLRTKKS